MTGKRQWRREKNNREAHGRASRLPPPPKQRELDALPSKLRHLIAFQNKQNSTAKADADASSGNPGKQGDDGAGKNKARKDKERISLWQEKLNQFENWNKAPLRPTTTVNTQAAVRFIGHSLSHLTADQKRSMQAISRGEGGGWSGKKRKPHPSPDRKSVRAAAEEFLAKGPVRLIPYEDED